MLCFCLMSALSVEPVEPVVTVVKPVRTEQRGKVLFADFGRAAFAGLEIKTPADGASRTYTIRLGEKLTEEGEIDRRPPGSVCFIEVSATVGGSQKWQRIVLPQKKNPGVRLPARFGEVAPFRYTEIEGADPLGVRQIALHAPFNDRASRFKSSDETLNAVWNLCKYSMKATSAFGLYIDGDRERLPYEADAYINMLSHYAVDLDPRVARSTFDYLILHPTWPTEWSLHMPMIAAEDFRATGSLAMAAKHYESLKKLLLRDKAREDGLLKAWAIVDWPAGERDDFNKGVKAPHDNRQIGPEVNSVVNAFYYRALADMAELAQALGRQEDSRELRIEADRVRQSFNRTFWDHEAGLYLDGEGTDHSSLHANMFPLAFGLAPRERIESVADFVASKGMACSVYGAQYLLEAVFTAGRDHEAVALMAARSKRSWWNMIQAGSTITMEAWDQECKPNQDWNHGWGAAPGNIIARYVMGVTPITPGYRKLRVQPQLGGLDWVGGAVPTPHGGVAIKAKSGGTFTLEVATPLGTEAVIHLPAGYLRNPTQNGKPIQARREMNSLVIEGIKPGRHVIQAQLGP